MSRPSGAHVGEMASRGDGTAGFPPGARAQWRGWGEYGHGAARNATEGAFAAKKRHSVQFPAGTFRQRLIWR